MKKLLNPRFLFMLLILGTAFFYIGLRSSDRIFHWAILFFFFVMILLFPLIHWNYEAHAWPRAKVTLQRLSYLSLGFMSWMMVLTLVRDVVLMISYFFGGSLLVERISEASLGAPIFLSAAILTAFGTWQTYFGLRVRELSVPIVDLPEALVGLRMVQISDLHVGINIGRRFVERLVKVIEQLRPDLTMMTGDIGDGRAKELHSAMLPLARLAQSGKVFYVPGNHEYYWHIDEWISELQSLNANVLLNEGASVDHKGQQVWVGGVTDPTAAQINRNMAPNPQKAAQGGEHAGLRVLLSHRPGMAQAAEDAGFHLQLSGHTHGGQFFPWTLVAKFFHEYLKGLIKHGKIWLYVSPGTGTWGPPIRIGTTPEVTVLTMKRA